MNLQRLIVAQLFKKLPAFLCKRDEMICGYRILHNDKLHNLYSSQNIIRIIKSRSMILAGHVACNRGEEECIISGKARRKKTARRRRRRREDNIKMDLRETEWSVMDWIFWLRIRTSEHGNEPSGSIKCCETVV
jgi:hypothetical protein